MIQFSVASLRNLNTAAERIKFIDSAMRQVDRKADGKQALSCLGHLADLAREHAPYNEVAENDGFGRLHLPPPLPFSHAGSSALMASEAGGV